MIDWLGDCIYALDRFIDRCINRRMSAYERGKYAAIEWIARFPADHTFSQAGLKLEGESQAAGVFFTQPMRDEFFRGWQTVTQEWC